AAAAPGPGGMMAGMRPPGGPGGPQQGMSGMMMRPPGQQGAAGGAPSASQMEMMARMGPQGKAGQPGGGAEANGMNSMAASMMAQQGRGMQGPGGAFGLGGPGAGGKAEAGDTNSPDGAVKAFLSALEDKDRDRLTEATALRATSVEEGGKYRDLFSRIIDSSISDSELSDLAAKLEGFKVSGENQVKSTGRLGVTVRKPTDSGGMLQRTVTVRKEKKGWGVLDISGQTEFKSGGMRNVNKGAQGKK
ncbi:MAG: hypothetical protein P4L85_05730, partial [Paludisphaera borealis]|uniref:hypothetical protein n=1 Tax=Paludisphaera borealis TaxID=1387353 RepID=UPI00284161AF|nr:hypothetical protein [Paludisphaera borealis]